MGLAASTPLQLIDYRELEGGLTMWIICYHILVIHSFNRLLGSTCRFHGPHQKSKQNQRNCRGARLEFFQFYLVHVNPGIKHLQLD
jgi:hypothetical protein